MNYIMKVTFPNETGNIRIKDPQFGTKMKENQAEVKDEAAYFGTICGSMGGYIVVNVDNASQIPPIGEPFFLWMNADIDFIPVMTPKDRGKAGPSIETA